MFEIHRQQVALQLDETRLDCFHLPLNLIVIRLIYYEDAREAAAHASN